MFLLTALALVLVISGFQCSSDQRHRAAQATAAVAQSLKGLEQANEELYSAKLISAEETIRISLGIRSVTFANDQFVENVRALKKIDASNKAMLLSFFGNLTQSVATLNHQGVLAVKNPKAQARLQVALAAVETALQQLNEFISTVPDHKSQLPLSGVPIAAVVVNEEMLLTLLALAIRLFGITSSVVQAIKNEAGLSDEDLLALAEKTDSETRDAIARHIEDVKSQASGSPTSEVGSGG